MANRIWDILLVLVVWLSLVGPASAELVTVEVEGVVNSIRTEAGFTLDGSVSVGSAMTGTCTYDTDLLNQGDTLIGIYSPILISMSVGNYTFTDDPAAPDATFFVYPGDHCYRVHSGAPHFDGTIYANGSPKTYDDINWYRGGLEFMNLLTSSDEHILTSELPDLDSFPELSVFDWRREFEVHFTESGEVGSRGYFGIVGEITSLTVVPEPTTVLLLALGSLVLRRKPSRGEDA